MKKLLLSAFLVLFSLSMFSFSSFSQEISGKEEKYVQIESMEEFYNYKKDYDKYIYHFIIENTSNKRAVCYMCGSSTMSTVNDIRQYSNTGRMCPHSYPFGNLDSFLTYYKWEYERCTSCGYKSSEWDTGIRIYEAECYNGGINSLNGTNSFPVSSEYTFSDGYDPHFMLSWWLNYEYQW